MNRSQILLETFRRHQLPQYSLVPRETRGENKSYERETEIRGARFRFIGIITIDSNDNHVLSMLFQRWDETSQLWVFTPTSTPDLRLKMELIRQLLGFIFSVLDLNPDITDIYFTASAENNTRTQTGLYREISRYLSRHLGWEYEASINPYASGFLISKPQE